MTQLANPAVPAPAAPTLADDERTLLHLAAGRGPLSSSIARILAEYGRRGAHIAELEAVIAQLDPASRGAATRLAAAAQAARRRAGLAR